MKLRMHALAAAAALTLAGGAALAQGPEVTFSGFGTLGVVHSDERNADFVATIFQPNGAGRTRPTAITPDTKLGLQANVLFNPKWSAVVQLVSQHRHDNTFAPEIEWANIKYQPTPEWAFRVGRIAGPFLMQSDTRLVGYAQPWVRPPVEVYGIMPVTRNDGIDVLWRKHFGRFDNTVQAYFGQHDAHVPGNIKAEAKPAWGISNTVGHGDLTLRAGYSYAEVDLFVPGWDSFLRNLGMFTALPDPIGSQAAALVQKYSTRDIDFRVLSLGATYDPGNWFLMGEFVDMRGESFLRDTRGWYVTGGYRFGTLTPYLSYSTAESDRQPPETGLPIPAAAPLNAVLARVSSVVLDQTTISAGVRWDFRPNAALKLQYDHMDLGPGSFGRFINRSPAFQPGSNVNLFSATLDFVF